MKRHFCAVFLLVLLGVFFNACSTDVDLYADYKDITVVYGLMDYNMDTNYVKINKAFLGPGNAYDIALIADSCNYPNKLDARIIEYRASASGTNYQATRTLELDTITIHDKETGLFYAPDQLVYYTAKRLNKNTSQYKYQYELQIDRGDTILSGTTDIVGGDAFYIETKPLSFATDIGTVKWYKCPNAAIYEVVVNFYFTELNLNTNDSVERCMTWSLGTYPLSTLTEENGKYSVSYKSDLFYSNLASFLGDDTLNINVDRIVKDPCLGVSIAAGGEELYNFISVNGPSSSIVQTIPEYTNISGGGYGVFSSRVSKEQRVRMTSLTDLIARENWRFRQG